MFSCSKDQVVGTNFVSPSAPASDMDARYATQWLDIEYRIISDQHNDSPPPPSRLYAYSCVTIYECVAPGIQFSRSLSGQLNDMPQMPQIDKSLQYDWPTVIAGAMPMIISGTYDTLFPNSVNLVNTTYNSILQERRSIISEDIISRSLEHGAAIGNKILEWASTDNYRETRTMVYAPPPRSINPANWAPINPGDLANEPFWGRLRPFLVKNIQDFYIPPTPFSTNAGSDFYNQAVELVDVFHNLTLDQKQIANFWNDKVRTGTPSGHWVSIVSQVSRLKNMKLDKIAEVYGYMGPTMADGFIVCWSAKYYYNLLRPQTYIQDYVDPDWFPFLITPPFPAYPSGHSSESGAVAEVLTYLLGTVAFTDYTHQGIDLNPRSYNSFNDAATEAGFSRQYGGIHFRTDIENGLTAGHTLGRYMVNNIHLKIF
jgi:hypothetical protein